MYKTIDEIPADLRCIDDGDIAYYPEIGVFFWSRSRRNVRVGDRAGYVHTDTKGNRYIYICYKRRRIRAHRLAWEMYYKEKPPVEIDHIDRNGLNNKIKNLRASTSSENKKNRSIQKNNSTGVAGVRLHSNKRGWYSTIQVSKETIYLGYFSDFFEACCVRKSAENKYGFVGA